MNLPSAMRTLIARTLLGPTYVFVGLDIVETASHVTVSILEVFCGEE